METGSQKQWRQGRTRWTVGHKDEGRRTRPWYGGTRFPLSHDCRLSHPFPQVEEMYQRGLQVTAGDPLSPFPAALTEPQWLESPPTYPPSCDMLSAPHPHHVDDDHPHIPPDKGAGHHLAHIARVGERQGLPEGVPPPTATQQLEQKGMRMCLE